MICAKLIQMGKPIQDAEISGNPTVQGLLNALSVTVPANSTITRNGVEVNLYTQLYNGDKVFIGTKTKGNVDEPFEVQLIRMGAGGGIEKLPATDGMTIQEVIDQLSEEKKASFKHADGSPAYEYRIGTRKVELTEKLYSPTGSDILRIILSQKVKGNKS